MWDRSDRGTIAGHEDCAQVIVFRIDASAPQSNLGSVEAECEEQP
jgi:hypothetical protein